MSCSIFNIDFFQNETLSQTRAVSVKQKTLVFFFFFCFIEQKYRNYSVNSRQPYLQTLSLILQTLGLEHFFVPHKCFIVFRWIYFNVFYIHMLPQERAYSGVKYSFVIYFSSIAVAAVYFEQIHTQSTAQRWREGRVREQLW